MQILGTTPLNLQENIKAFREIEARKEIKMFVDKEKIIEDYFAPIEDVRRNGVIL